MKKLLIIPMLFMCSMVIGQTYNSDSIIGKPIRIRNLEVAQNDFPKEMTWYDAKKACTDLGNGWRLPTKDELNLLYINKDKIGGFADYYYWSSTEYNNSYAWIQDFDGGKQYDDYKSDKYYVRAVRAF
jgi:hypothetical protein